MINEVSLVYGTCTILKISGNNR